MLAAPNRLVSSAAFSSAVRGGRRAGSRTVVVHAAPPAPGPGVEETRVGFVVSRAVGNAVVRNRVKRRLRHLMRDRLDVAPRGSLLVVRALPAAAASDVDRLGRDLDHCLGSALR